MNKRGDDYFIWHVIRKPRTSFESSFPRLQYLIHINFGNTKGLHEALTLTELNDYMDELRSRGADNVNIYQIEEYIRYMSPFSVIILTLIGLIVSARKSRGGTGFQIALGFVIAFVFIIFFILSRAIAESNSMNPILAVWIPNIVFSLVGVLLYKTVPR